MLNLAIEISNRQTFLAVPAEALIRIARSVLQAEGILEAAVSIVLVDDATIQIVNREQLGHDWATDVITFPLSHPGEIPMEAELLISAEMAAVTASQSGADPMAELSLYVVHGLLHLCGYDDLQADQAHAMRRREAELLEELGIVNTFTMVSPMGQGGSS